MWLLSLAVALVSRPLSLGLMLLLGVAFALMLVQYRATYARLYGHWRTDSPITDGLRWGLVGGHFALGFVMIPVVGILAAVLIPNLLNARKAALERAHQAYAQNAYTAVMASEAEGQPPSNDCLHGAGSYTVTPLDDVTSCQVDRRDPAKVRVIVTLKDGSTQTVP